MPGIAQVTRRRVPDSALNLSQLAADLTALRQAMATTPSFINAWPETTQNTRAAVSAVLNDVEAAILAADLLMGDASLVANVVPYKAGGALATAFRRFKVISDQSVILYEMRGLLLRMRANIAAAESGHSDADYPDSTTLPQPLIPPRVGGIYDLGS